MAWRGEKKHLGKKEETIACLRTCVSAFVRASVSANVKKERKWQLKTDGRTYPPIEMLIASIGKERNKAGHTTSGVAAHLFQGSHYVLIPFKPQVSTTFENMARTDLPTDGCTDGRTNRYTL